MKPLIDGIDASILKELLKDGRCSFADLAKQCGTSDDAIAKRYKQMKKKGIIMGATVQTSCACYDCNLVASIIIEIQSGKTHEVAPLVLEIPNIINVYNIRANRGLSALAILKNMEEAEKVKQSIKKIPFILAMDLRVWIGIRSTPENLSVFDLVKNPDKTDKFQISTGKRKKIKIDKTDLKIIDELATDGRIPFQKIAKKFKMSTDTIARRYEKLTQNHDTKVVIQIDPTKIGYQAFAIFNLAFIEDNLDKSLELLAAIPDINFIIKNTGVFDCTLSLMIRDINQFTTLQEQISAMPSVTNMRVDIEKLFAPWPVHREFISTF
jgi:DNA-binding Lrp family transcriptional regulator